MKYYIQFVQNGIPKTDFGQNNGFDTVKDAICHAKEIGLAVFTPIPFGTGEDWTKVDNDPGPVCRCNPKAKAAKVQNTPTKEAEK